MHVARCHDRGPTRAHQDFQGFRTTLWLMVICPPAFFSCRREKQNWPTTHATTFAGMFARVLERVRHAANHVQPQQEADCDASGEVSVIMARPAACEGLPWGLFMGETNIPSAG